MNDLRSGDIYMYLFQIGTRVTGKKLIFSIVLQRNVKTCLKNHHFKRPFL